MKNYTFGNLKVQVCSTLKAGVGRACSMTPTPSLGSGRLALRPCNSQFVAVDGNVITEWCKTGWKRGGAGGLETLRGLNL